MSYHHQLSRATESLGPTAASLRRLIDKVLRGDADLEAFCLDHFPRVKQRLSGGMERRIKVTLLLEQEDKVEVLDALAKNYPETIEKYAHLIRFERIIDGPPEFNSEDITQRVSGGFMMYFERFSEKYPMVFHSIMMIVYSLVCWIGVSLIIGLIRG